MAKILPYNSVLPMSAWKKKDDNCAVGVYTATGGPRALPTAQRSLACSHTAENIYANKNIEH